MRHAVIAAMACAAFAAACKTTPPSKYYTLDMTPSGTAVPDYGIEVQRIRSAEPLARRDILVKTSPTEIEYYALDQWSADPGLLVAEKLQAEFGHRTDAEKQVRLTGQLLAFEQQDTPGGPAARVKLNLEFRTADRDLYDDPLLKKTYEIELPAASPGPGGVVRALSQAIERIAAEIVADADALE